ncbi:MAG TPA: hypothetical protein VL283_01265 [Candidatus Baltobacteraceae bacterium]|nr:hypothetical protein [Candidatus Baltobacteraceae bacterium]
MRISRKFEHGDSFQDMSMEQTYRWTDDEMKRIPACVRNAVEAAATLGSRFFEEGVEYAFAIDAKGRPTLLDGTAEEFPYVHERRIDYPLKTFWRDLLQSASKSFAHMKSAPDIDKTDVKRPFLAQLMLLDILLHENPYHETRDFEGGGVWKNSWHDRRDWTRQRFLQEVSDLRSPT